MSIKVLVVDDSLFMRKLISDMLNSEPGIEVVDTAQNGSEAMAKLPKLKPDCITLDLVMPGDDGLTTLKRIMDEYPTPVIILSAHSQKDADSTMECLEAGAVSFVLKPSGELSLDIEKVKDQLITEVRAAARAKVGRLKPLIFKKPKEYQPKAIGVKKIIVIGASTGGPQTLGVVLSALPHDFAIPILIVQHMPSIFFSQSLANRLNITCPLPVNLAQENEVIQPGQVYIAPGGFHLTIRQKGANVFLRLSEDQLSGLSPSIDQTMKSAAQIWRGNTIGIILSGLGTDGVEGMKAIKDAGGTTMTQDKSSLIFGMPKAVIEAGWADMVLPVSEMADTILEITCEKMATASNNSSIERL
jgi:two-component system, chemotaxis family, protein-glutamate methylesterase/glutaminase